MKNVVNVIRSVSVAVCLVSAALPAVAGQTLDRVMANKKVVIATTTDWVPISYVDSDGHLVGFDVDVAKELGRRLGVAVELTHPDGAVLRSGHWGGRFDVAVASITPTVGRSHLINFPAIYYYVPYVFVVKKDSSIDNRAALNGKSIAVEAGATAEDYINRRLQLVGLKPDAIRYTITNPTIKAYPNSAAQLEDLRVGRVDALVLDEPVALSAIARHYPVKAIPNDVAYSEPEAIATDKGDPEWDKKIADTIKSMQDDGTIAKISMKWLHKDYSKPQTQQ